MDTLLMVVTVIALALAMALSVLGSKLLGNRRRSAARIRTLQALAADAPSAGRFQDLDEFEDEDDDLEEIEEQDLTLEDRETWDLPLRGGDGPRSVENSAGETRPPRRWVALAAAGLMISAAVATIYTGYAPVAAAESLLPAWAPELRLGTPRPLELLSLRHSTEAGTFTITGLVQNPSSGTAVRDVLAVVYLFDRDGDFFASGKAPLEFALLEPGGESPFVVRVPTSLPVRRYRVGFRYGAGGVVAHVDRRGLPPASTTGDALDAPRLPPRAAAAWGESDGRR